MFHAERRQVHGIIIQLKQLFFLQRTRKTDPNAGKEKLNMLWFLLYCARGKWQAHTSCVLYDSVHSHIIRFKHSKHSHN